MADDTVSVKVQGLSELASALRDLPERIGKNVLRGAVSAGAADIRKEAKLRAPNYTGPVSEGHPPPGTLKRAIYQKRDTKKSNNVQQTFYVSVRQAYNARSGAGSRSVAAYSDRDAYYWRFVEFGTVKMAARPFLRPAFETKKNEAVETIRQYLAERIPREAEKLNRGPRT